MHLHLYLRQVLSRWENTIFTADGGRIPAPVALQAELRANATLYPQSQEIEKSYLFLVHK